MIPLSLLLIAALLAVIASRLYHSMRALLGIWNVLGLLNQRLADLEKRRK